MDNSIKRDGELPSADPHTAIPLKYEQTCSSGAIQTHISMLLDPGVCVCVCVCVCMHTCVRVYACVCVCVCVCV